MQKYEIEYVQKIPDDITPVLIQAVLMPNGEIIRNGVTIEWLKENDLTKKDIYSIIRAG